MYKIKHIYIYIVFKFSSGPDHTIPNKVFHENLLEYETGQEDVIFVENSNFNPQRYTCRLWIKKKCGKLAVMFCRLVTDGNSLHCVFIVLKYKFRRHLLFTCDKKFIKETL